MIPDQPTQVMPYQLPVLEMGSTGGLPVANQIYRSQWHDVYRPHVEEIIVPQTGAKVRTDDVSALPDTLLRFSGVFILDLFCIHANAGALPLLVQVDNNIASALGGSFALGGIVYTVASSVPFSASVRLTARLMRIRWTYPNANATFFGFNAVLRGL